MPLDGQAQWQIDILAADKTAQAFASVDRRLDKTTKTLDAVTRTMRTQQDALAGGAEKTAKSFDATAQSMTAFDKRVNRTIANLEFERLQLTRTAEARERYAALNRAGVSDTSAAGRSISASVAALQAQRAASKAAEEAARRAAEAMAKAQQRKVLLANADITGHDGFGTSIARIGSVLAGAMGAGAILQAADAYTRFTNQLKVAGVAAGNMDEVQRSLFASAQKNGVEIEALGKLFSRASMAAGELGADQSKLLEFTDGVTAALRLQGGSSEEASGALLQLSQALGSGIVRAEEFNSVLEGAYPIAQAAARGIDGMNGSVAKLRAAVADGQVTSKQFFAGLLKGFAETRASAESMALTVGQASTNLETSWIKLIGQADKLIGISSTLASGIGAGASIMEQLAANTERANRALASLPKDASFWEKLDAIFGGRYGNNTMGGLRLANEAELAAIKLGDAQKRLNDLEAQRPNASGMAARTLEDQIARQQAVVDALNRQRVNASQSGAQDADAAARGIMLPPVEVNAQTGGPSDIKPKGSDPYAKAIESAKEYILSKKAETAAIGESVLVAARLKHEQDLLNKATGDGKVLTAAQTQALKDLAGQMAEADNVFATTKYMDDLKTKSEEFVQQQQIEMQSIGLSAEATARLRYEQQMLNDAKRQGIELSGADIETIRRQAQEMAAIEEQVRQQREMYEFARDTFKDFFTSIRDDLKRGATVWEAFGNAGANALDKIAGKLFDMAANKLVEQAFGGSGSSGGGAAGGILNLFSGLFSGGGGGNAWSGLSANWGFAKGGVFRGGNVIPFASGGVVGSPTLFPMSGGRTGLMGEAGPEAIMPLRRMPGGGLGVAASVDGAGGATVVNVYQTVHVGEFVTTTEYARGLSRVRESAIEGAKAGVLADRKRGGPSKQVFRR